MSSPLPVGSTVVLVMSLVASVAAPVPPKPGPTDVITLTGRVVLLTEALKASGVAFDAEPVVKQVVLKGADGMITPLLSDDASRALFMDKSLRNRSAELKVVKSPGSPYVRVVALRVEEEGRLRTPEYYCEICSISLRFPQICPCCQAEMVLRMKPEPD